MDYEPEELTGYNRPVWAWWKNSRRTARHEILPEAFAKLEGGKLVSLGTVREYRTRDEAIEDLRRAL